MIWITRAKNLLINHGLVRLCQLPGFWNWILLPARTLDARSPVQSLLALKEDCWWSGAHKSDFFGKSWFTLDMRHHKQNISCNHGHVALRLVGWIWRGKITAWTPITIPGRHSVVMEHSSLQIVFFLDLRISVRSSLLTKLWFFALNITSDVWRLFKLLKTPFTFMVCGKSQKSTQVSTAGRCGAL